MLVHTLLSAGLGRGAREGRALAAEAQCWAGMVMRGDLQDPPIDADIAKRAAALAAELYRLHEAGQPTEASLQQLSDLCGLQVNRSDFIGAFGSVSAESFAKDLLAGQLPCPLDLSREDLIELIEAVCAVRGEEWQSAYWLRCLEEATGCPEIIDLIYYPQATLGDGDGRVELTPEEVLVEAAKRPRRVLLTPPPK